MGVLDKILELLQSMTDEEIIEATDYINGSKSGYNELEGFEIIDPSSFLKSSKNMIMIPKERYGELLEIEAMYNDLCK